MDDGSAVARLMAYMEDSRGSDEEFPPRLSGRMQYFKETEEGRTGMSDLVEEYAKATAAEALDAMKVEGTLRDDVLTALGR